ncbi:HIV Tat-specific factor 1 [Entomortierella parvispora]|uniref:HIV Tat-specific factor 1 n=1 Tax=Entomortierella parvispora TaxID=205924 RepID=A0A9P3HKV7_9FUNG|nr:HIV Tat-specific factor 1 [Entomortierella parvispora]
MSDQKQQPAGSGAPQVEQQNMRFIEETGRWTYTDAEGISFEYDENLKAWFPMFNEQLIQAQQSAYGETIPENMESVYVENERRRKRQNEDNYASSSHSEQILEDDALEGEFEEFQDSLEAITRKDPSDKRYQIKKSKPNPNKTERKPKPISSVFVTGLPLDTDLEEVMEVFKKGGVFMEDESEKPRIKLYTDKEGRKNGEALVTYLRHESVPLAIDLLDDTEYRPGVEKGRIRVQQAQFKEKEKPTSATPAAGLTEERKKKVQKKYQKLEKKLDWFEDDETLAKADKWNKVCILKHMFTLQELEADPTLLLDLKEDIREECEKVGEVTNVIIYDQHPEGVVSVRYKDKESAELCVKLMSGRYFAGQRVEAEIYDGHTKYESTKTKEELEEEEKQRLDRYAKWLEAEEERAKQAEHLEQEHAEHKDLGSAENASTHSERDTIPA